MKKFILFNLIGLIANIGFISGIALLFKNQVYIAYHIDQNLFFGSVMVFSISIVLISKILSELFGKATSQYILRIIMGLLTCSFSLNIGSFLIAIKNIVNYKDEIFSCKFFTIYYRYTTQQLLKFIDDHYEAISKLGKRLTIKERSKILGDSTTIREKVESYCDYEENSIWNKVYNGVSNIISYSFDHPMLSAGAVTVLGLLLSYPCWQWIKTTYNVQAVAISVSEVNTSVAQLNQSMGLMQTSMLKVTNLIKNTGKIELLIIGILSDFFEFEVNRITEDPQLSNEDRIIDLTNIISFRQRLAEILDSEAVKNIVEESNTTTTSTSFTGSGTILGGEATHSRLLDNININE